MSASAELKNEIIEHVGKSSCCRRAMLTGILFAKGRTEDKRLVLSLEKREYAEFVSTLVSEFYGKEAEIFRSSKGGRNVFLFFDSPSALKYITEIDKITESDFNVIVHPKCRSCMSSFLRGVFFAAGRLSDPQKQYSLDFSLGERSSLFSDMLLGLSMAPRISHKQSGDIVYFRKGDDIESFFGHAGLNKVVFDVIERKITTLARRESQRYLNCVTKNYDRMTAASERQISIISRLKDTGLLSALPEELVDTAKMRLDNPDLPLSSLAARMTPSVTKSGLSHRLKKIEELGSRLLGLTED